jgi:phage terminase large subunit
LATENKYKYSKAYYKILSLILDNPNEKVFVIRGGQGASKTISIIELIIQSLCASEKEATILSSELSKMKRTVIRDYKKICKDWGIIQNEDEFNRSESKHEYRNGSYLDFLGADVTDVGKGFRRDILYINEADKMDIETAIQFISRAKLTIIDYNPDKLFWGDEFINEHNFITLTYEDNEFLSDSEVKSILEYKEKGFHNTYLPQEELFKELNVKSKYWANKWKVYGLGMVGSLDGVIFDDWLECIEIPLGAELIGIGMDFGFTNDPTTAIKVFKYNKDLYLDELIYQSGLTNSDIARMLRDAGVTKSMQIVADSAEPKSIEELSREGFRIEGAEKGADSIRYSIDLLKQFKIFITKRSQKTIKEFETWRWSDKNPNEPIGTNDHSIAAIRYIALNKINKNTGKYTFV